MNKKRLLHISIFLTCFLSLLLCYSIAYAEEVSYVESENAITLDVSIPLISISEVKADDGNTYHKVSMPDSDFTTNKEGSPSIPYITKNIHIPDQATNISVKTQINSSPVIYNDILVYPVPKQVIKKTEEGYEYIDEEFYIDKEAYKSNCITPPDIAQLTQDGYFRSVRMIKLDIYPARYTPATKELELNKDITITIAYTIDPSIPVKKDTTKGFEKMINGLIINPESVKEREEPLKCQTLSESLTTQGSIAYITGSQLRDTAINCDYLIVTHPDFFSSTELADFANYRANYNKLNIVIAKVDDIYTQFPNASGNDYSIKDFIQYAYDNWNTAPQYLLIVGDVEYVPTHKENYYSYVMDYEAWYACISGEDELPDLAIGRLPVRDEAEIAAAKRKIYSYEQTSIEPGSYHKRALCLEGAFKNVPEVANILSDAGFEVTTLYKVNGNSQQEFTYAINAGQNFVYFCGHGDPLAWDYPFRAEYIDRDLANTFYPIIFTTSCSTADLDSGGTHLSIGETFVLAEDKGAVAYYGATITSSGSLFAYHALAKVFEDFQYDLGKALLIGEIENIGDNYDLAESKKYILLGDPALQFFGYKLNQDTPDIAIPYSGVEYNRQNKEFSVSVYNLGTQDAENVSVELFKLDDISDERHLIGEAIIASVPVGGCAEARIINPEPNLRGEATFVAAGNCNEDPFALNNQAGQRIITSPTFIDITSGAGITFPYPTQPYPLIATVDIDNDGLEDLCFKKTGCVYQEFLFYLNNGDGTFSQGQSVGVGNGSINNGTFGDVDSDGDADFYIVCEGGLNNSLLLNNGDEGFTDITNQAGLDGYSTYGKPIFADVDNDGDLDLYIVHYRDYGDVLFINNGYDTTAGSVVFTNETDKRGLGGLYTLARPMFTDIDNDDDLDLLVPNMNPTYGSDKNPRVYLNDSAGYFTEQTPANIAESKCQFGISAGDIDLDGDFDILYKAYYTGTSHDGNRFNLMRQSDASGHDFECISPTNLSRKIWLGNSTTEVPPIFVDINNISGEDIISARYLVENSGMGTFKKYENTKYPGTLQNNCRSMIAMDIEGDGDIDIIKDIYNSGVEILQNQTNNNNWLKVKPIGVQSNRDAIGARVYVYSSSNELVGHQDVSTQKPAPLHFGLDCNDTYRVEVHWPASGITDVRENVSPTQLLTIIEGEPVNTPPTLNPIGNRTGNEATNFVISKIVATDPDNDPITIEATNLPNGARFFQVSPTNIGRVEYKLSWPAKFVRQGVYENITFTARDLEGATDSETITITINDTQNFAPVLVPIRNRTGIVGRDFILKGIVANDFDNDPITIEVQNAPPASWVTQVSSSNIGKVEYKFVWRARGITPGVHTLTFIARDPAGGIDSETITITIP